MQRRVIDWVLHPLSAMGSAETIWFGVMVLLNLKWKVAPALFPPEPTAVFVLLGVGSILLGCAGIANTRALGLIATLFVCGERGWQAQQTHNPYAVGVWVIIAVSLGVWDVWVLPVIKPALVRAIPDAWKG